MAFEEASKRIAAAFSPVFYDCNIRDGSCGAFVDIVVVSAAFEGEVLRMVFRSRVLRWPCLPSSPLGAHGSYVLPLV